ncbi:MAG: thioredoxin [Candidatus Sericytochromatia bacterium]|nr:thioredoxin [Candidatus Sericytochromatia bacterium]
MSTLTAITDATFKSEVLEATTPVLVDFWAPWCGPCKMIAPILDQIAGEKGDNLRIAKLDVDDNGATAQQFGVMSIPTLILFKGGQEVLRVTGFKPKDQLLALIDAKLA